MGWRWAFKVAFVPIGFSGAVQPVSTKCFQIRLRSYRKTMTNPKKQAYLKRKAIRQAKKQLKSTVRWLRG